MKTGEEKFLKEKRGEIITHFAYLEDLMKKFISSYYFKTGYHPIVEDIFEDEYFSFGLLFKIFEKLINRNKIEFPTKKLRRLGQLRNIIAHAQVYAKGLGFSKEEITSIYFRHNGEEKDINSIFNEYDETKMDVHERLKEILRPYLDIQPIPERKEV